MRFANVLHNSSIPVLMVKICYICMFCDIRSISPQGLPLETSIWKLGFLKRRITVPGFGFIVNGSFVS